MNLNLYLPDDIGAEAKEADLPFSRLLRDAVSTELHRRAAVREALTNSTIHEVTLEDKDGRTFTGRITGKQIANSRDLDVYLTDDERVILHDKFRLKHWVLQDPSEDLREQLEPGAYADAMNALGLKPVIDI